MYAGNSCSFHCRTDWQPSTCLGMCGPLVIAWSLRYRTATQAGCEATQELCFSPGHFCIILRSMPGGSPLTPYWALLSRVFFVHWRSKDFRCNTGRVFSIASGITLICLALVIIRALPLPHFVIRLLSPRGIPFRNRPARVDELRQPWFQSRAGPFCRLTSLRSYLGHAGCSGKHAKPVRRICHYGGFRAWDRSRASCCRHVRFAGICPADGRSANGRLPFSL